MMNTSTFIPILQQIKDLSNTRMVRTNTYYDLDTECQVYEYTLIEYESYYTFYKLCCSYVDENKIDLYECFVNHDDELVASM